MWSQINVKLARYPLEFKSKLDGIKVKKENIFDTCCKKSNPIPNDQFKAYYNKLTQEDKRLSITSYDIANTKIQTIKMN